MPMRRRPYSSRLLVIVTLILTAAPLLLAEAPAARAASDSPAASTEALHFLARLNSPSALQPAACHGSYGTDVGAGLENLSIPTTNAVLQDQLGLANADQHVAPNYSVPRLWLTKGLPLPVDFSFSAGLPGNNRNLTQVSGYLQWTVYEALARPAFAVRSSYGRLSGASGTTVSSWGGEAVASYGVLRYATIFGRVGILQHQGNLVPNKNSAATLGLTNDSSAPTLSTSWRQKEAALGLKVTLWSPFTALSAETDYGYAPRPSYSVKLSYLL
jgi:hypothetical protein